MVIIYWIGKHELNSSVELLQGFNVDGQLYLEPGHFFRKH
jgi:hypothetical protein